MTRRREAPKGTSQQDGCCNELLHGYDPTSFRVYYCHRPDNGTGICNVHQAARARGDRQRLENARLRRLIRKARP